MMNDMVRWDACVIFRKVSDFIRATAARCERRGEALVIRPDEALGISRTEKEPDELERVYQEGRRIAAERLDEIKAFLEIKEPEISDR